MQVWYNYNTIEFNRKIKLSHDNQQNKELVKLNKDAFFNKSKEALRARSQFHNYYVSITCLPYNSRKRVLDRVGEDKKKE